MLQGPQPTDAARTMARRLERLAMVLLVFSLVPVLIALGIPALARARGERLLLVISGSMTPAFSPGDVVRIRPVPPDELRPGMVVTFRPPDSTTYQTHRIVSVRHLPSGQYIQTKGDANAHPDPNFTPVGNVLGEMDGDLGTFGPLLTASQTPGGRALLFGTPLLLLALAQLLSFADRTRADLDDADDLEVLADLDLTAADIADLTDRTDVTDVTDQVSDGHLSPAST